MIVFDIETGPLPLEQLKAALPPFDPMAAVPDVGEFDASTVKCGNLGAEKAAAKVEEARAAHESRRAQLPRLREMAAQDYVAKAVEKAALSAITGCVKAIGWKNVDTSAVLIFHAAMLDETDLLRSFWQLHREQQAHSLVGHNIFGFDLPFLIRRSWLLGVDVPDGIRQSGGRYWASQFIDLMDRWSCGARDFISLDTIDRALGGQGKPDDCTGADFARMFDAGGEEREKALAYLVNDLEMTQRVAEAMQLL
jgi:hypothetical protein